MNRIKCFLVVNIQTYFVNPLFLSCYFNPTLLISTEFLYLSMKSVNFMQLMHDKRLNLNIKSITRHIVFFSKECTRKAKNIRKISGPRLSSSNLHKVADGDARMISSMTKWLLRYCLVRRKSFAVKQWGKKIMTIIKKIFQNKLIINLMEKSGKDLWDYFISDFSKIF